MLLTGGPREGIPTSEVRIPTPIDVDIRQILTSGSLNIGLSFNLKSLPSKHENHTLVPMTDRLPPRPLSPWAERFGPEEDPFWHQFDDLQHSGLAPEFPSVDDTHQPRLLLTAPLPKPSDEELDRLFYGERLQQNAFAGVKSWQMGPLTRYFWDGSFDATFSRIDGTSLDPRSGSERFKQDQIKVDEESWLPIFQKNRWLGLRTNALDGVKRPIPGIFPAENAYWTVDNTEIWARLSVSIELANKILLAMIKERNPL